MSQEDFEPPFDGEEVQMKVAFEFLANVAVPMYKAILKGGLTPQEAAALTAAILSQNVPLPGQEPQDGS